MNMLRPAVKEGDGYYIKDVKFSFAEKGAPTATITLFEVYCEYCVSRVDADRRDDHTERCLSPGAEARRLNIKNERRAQQAAERQAELEGSVPAVR
jgi:hypothetical protein